MHTVNRHLRVDPKWNVDDRRRRAIESIVNERATVVGDQMGMHHGRR
jgi:hypothetical protein